VGDTKVLPPGAWNNANNTQEAPNRALSLAPLANEHPNEREWPQEREIWSTRTTGTPPCTDNPTPAAHHLLDDTDQPTTSQTNIHDALNLPAGITSISFSTHEASNPLNDRPTNRPSACESICQASTLSVGAASARSGIQEAPNDSLYLSDTSMDQHPGTYESACNASNQPNTPPRAWTNGERTQASSRITRATPALAIEQFDGCEWTRKRGNWPTRATGTKSSYYDPRFLAEQPPITPEPPSDSRESIRTTSSLLVGITSSRIDDRGALNGALGRHSNTQMTSLITPATPVLTIEQFDRREWTQEAQHWSIGPAGMCPNDYRPTSAAQPPLSTSEPHASAHISARDAGNLPAGITSASSSAREASDRTNGTYEPPPSADTNACNAGSLFAGITSASSGTHKISNQTNDALGEHWTSSYAQSVTQRPTQATGPRLRAYTNGCDTINLPTGITSGSLGARETSSAQYDERTSESLATGVQCPSSGPPARKSAQHKE